VLWLWEAWSHMARSGTRSRRHRARRAVPRNLRQERSIQLSLTPKEGLTDCFYIDLGASDHLVPSKGDLRADRVFEQLVEIAVANSGKIYAYGTGYLRVATSASGVERR